jgi:hypothetical protein
LEELVVAEQAAMLLVHRFRGDGCSLIVKVCLSKEGVPDVVCFELLDCFRKRGFILYTHHNEMGMLRNTVEVVLCAFSDSMTGLHKLLPRRKVFSDENVNIRRADRKSGNLVRHCITFWVVELYEAPVFSLTYMIPP